MNKLEVGMKFDNMVKLCEFIGWEYDYKHSARLSQKLGEYVDFHRENRNKIIIDKIINPNVEMVQFKRRRNGYDYNVGDIIEVNNGKVEILEQTYITTKNGSKRKAYKVKCIKCGYIYTEYDYNLYKKIGSGCCSNKVVVKGINDMWTTNPELAKLLLNPDDGYKYTSASSQKVDWRCPICKTIYKHKTISNISKRGLSCLCSKSKSYPNRFMYWLLSELQVEFYDEKTFEWSDGKRYDFYIPDKNMIIEMHGKQHYEEVYDFTRQPLRYQIENDAYKKDLALHNDILNYVEINASQSDFDYIQNNVCNSVLAQFYNLSVINWDLIQEKCETNILYDIAECWNNGIYLAEDIGKIVGLSKSPIRKFLNKCEEFGLIKKYDKNIIKDLRSKKSHDTYYQNKSQPIKCNENGMYFGSLSICKNKMSEITGLNFSHGNIIGTITGTCSHHHHYIFSYISREEFNCSKLRYPNITFGDLFINTDTIKQSA